MPHFLGVGEVARFERVDRLPPVGREVTPPGWTAVRAGELPGQPWDLTRQRLMAFLDIVDDDTAAEAVGAVVRGVAVVATIDLPGRRLHALLEDVERSVPAASTALDPLDERLLDALAAGATVTDAARTLGLSRRSAGRRLVDLRAHFGVATNAEAVVAWVQHRPRP